ncbi:MAG: hypothetical protein DRO06_04250 [Thermoproteota archaeon]|nr:MAG: hypothetical protein DRO06_04250 [Candidatus Korarchaeota archaeon]
MPFLRTVWLSKRLAEKPLVLMQGVPGLGLVGKIAVQYLIDHLDAELVARIYSDYLQLPAGLPGVEVSGGTIHPPSYDLYLYEPPDLDESFLFLTSEVQPVPSGQYAVGEAVLDAMSSLGEPLYVFTFGGYVPGDSAVVGVFASSNDEDLLRKLESHRVKRLDGGFITGAAGVLVALAHLRGISSACVLSTTSGHMPDPLASKRILVLVGEMFGLEVDLSDLEGMIRRVPPRPSESEEGEAPSVAEEGEEDISYYL